MIYLNFTDLNEDAQQELMEAAREDMNTEELKEEAKLMNWDYETVLSEKASQHLYSYDYVFNI